MKIKTLWKGEWVSIISPNDHPYEALHEGNLAIVVPYIESANKFLVRRELCPPYLVKHRTNKADLYWTLISGGIEEGENPITAAYREIQEETGYHIKWADVDRRIDNIPIAKNATTRATIFFMTVKSYDRSRAEGDGTEYEEKSKTQLISLNEWNYIVQNEDDFDLHFTFGCEVANNLYGTFAS